MEVKDGNNAPGQTVWWFMAQYRQQQWLFMDYETLPIRLGRTYYVLNKPSDNVLDVDVNPADKKVRKPTRLNFRDFLVIN